MEPGDNLCEIVRDMLDTQHLIRYLLRLANQQTQCANDDCLANDDGLNDDLRRLEDPVTASTTASTSLTMTVALFAFLLIVMVFPNQNQLFGRAGHQRRPPTRQPPTEDVSPPKPHSSSGDHHHHDDDDLIN